MRRDFLDTYNPIFEGKVSKFKICLPLKIHREHLGD